MYSPNNLEVSRILPRQDGLFVVAKYPQWYYGYDFFVHYDGRIEGKTSSGNWLEVSKDLASLLRDKIRFILGEDSCNGIFQDAH